MVYDVAMGELPTYDQARTTTLSVTPTLGSETVLLKNAAGRVLREDIAADRDQPPFDRAAMDGFALLASSWEAGKSFRIVGSVPAGGELPADVEIDPSADVVRIATGAAVPGVFDAVVQIEKAVVSGDDAAVRFEVDAVRKGLNIHRRGADAAAGSVVIPAGTLLRPHHLGLAATVGAVELNVSRRPRVVVLSSGDEVWPPEVATAELTPQQIRNSNGPMLVGLLRAMGCDVVRHEHVVDESHAVRAACSQAIEDADLVVTAGGVSVGARDLFPATWSGLNYETVLHGVAMQPGKPVFVAQRTMAGSAKPQAACVIGLPGNPVSVLVTAHLFVWPMVRKMMGLSVEVSGSPGGESGGKVALPWRRVWLAKPAKPNARRESFRAVRFVGETREQVEVLPWQGSGDLVHTAAAEGWVRLPTSKDELPAGSGLSFLPMLGGGGGQVADRSGGSNA